MKHRLFMRTSGRTLGGAALLATFLATPVHAATMAYDFSEAPAPSEWHAWAEPDTGADCQWNRDTGRTRAGSLKINVSGDTIGWPHWSRTVTAVRPFDTWQVTVFVKTENVGDGHGAYIGLVCPAPGTTGGGETDRLAQADSSPVTGTEEWTRITEKIIVPPGAAQINLLLLLHGRGTAWFDDVRIERVAEPPGPVPHKIRASLRSEEIITRDLWGFGFEDDPFFYNDENRQKGVDAEAIELHAERIKALRPGWVRCFVWWEAVNPSRDLETIDLSGDNGQSLLQTLRTYQAQDIPVVLCGVEWGWSAKEVPFCAKNAAQGARFFAKLVRQLRHKHGLTCVRYLTITNEPDLYWEQRIGPFETFIGAHRRLAEALLDEGLAADVTIVGADVTVQQEFFDKSVAQTDAYCVAWSRHKYLKESQAVLFRNVVDAAVSSAKDNDSDGQAEPVLFAEFGFHWPETSDRSHTGIRNYEYGLLTAMAACDMLDGGAAGGSIWCLCRQMYPGFNFMDYGLWEYADEGWRVRPVAPAYSLFTRFVRPGDDAVKLALDPEHVHVRGAAVARNGVPVGVFLVNLSETPMSVALQGVPANSKWDRFEYRPDKIVKPDGVLLPPSATITEPAQVKLPAKSAVALVSSDRS